MISSACELNFPMEIHPSNSDGLEHFQKKKVNFFQKKYNE